MGLRDFAAFFRNEQEEREQQTFEMARQVSSWMSQDYHAKFLDWLDREASKPIAVSGNHMDMVQAAVRANTLREVKQHLERVSRDAQAAIRRATEEQSNG